MDINKDKRILKGEETKLKILKAGIELFSSKGYDAASVNEISKKAKLTKSLLYHHFKNKESILMQIMNDYQIRIKEIIDSLIGDQKEDDINGFFYNFQNSTHNYLYENSEIVRILLTESFKNKTITFNLFQIYNDLDEYLLSRAKEHFKVDENELLSKIEGFYFHFLPAIIFSVLNDTWCEFYKKSKKETQKIFFKLLEKIEKCKCEV